MDQAQEKIKPKRKIKFILLFTLIAALLAAAALFIKNMNGPAEGTVAYTSSNQTSLKPTTASSGKYEGQYISFEYPAHYKIVPSQKSNGILDTISLDNTDHSGKYVSISVLKEALGNDSGINYRKAHPELYTQVSSDTNRVVFAGKGASSERTGFIAHNGLVATVSVTANGSRDLSKDFDRIVNSLQWKQ
jgi:hypothetical protein